MTAPTRRGLFALIVGAFAAPALARYHAPPLEERMVNLTGFGIAPVSESAHEGAMIMTHRAYVVPSDWIVTREVLEDNLYAEVKEKVKPWLRLN